MTDFPCHSKPRDQWCDRNGPGGFMGHTCNIPQAKTPAEPMTTREIIGRAIYDGYDRRGAGHTISWGAMGDVSPHEQKPWLEMADLVLEDLAKQGATVVQPKPDDFIERFAIRCARGNNGGEWATHYNEDQKNVWRQFVRDLVAEQNAPLLSKAREMRNAIDQLEGAMMGLDSFVDLPKRFEDSPDELNIIERMTVGQMRRVCTALEECTRIINSDEFLCFKAVEI